MALYALLNSTRLPGESCQRFSYRILNLANLAYAGIAENTRKTIAKDYYVNGLSRELQVAWKSLHNYSTLDLKQLSDETTRLKLAGINAVKIMEIKAVDTPDASEIVTKITEKVLEQISSSKARNTESDEVNALRGGFNNFNISYRGNRGRDRGGYRDSRYNARNTPQTQDGKRCRACQSPSHFFRNCPVRHCQACGTKGHDAWNRTCPKYSWLTKPDVDLDTQVSIDTEQFDTINENADFSVVVRGMINDNPTNVMLDTGASLSVIDMGTIDHMKLVDNIRSIPNNSPKCIDASGNLMQIIGTVELKVKLVGTANVIIHKFRVLNTQSYSNIIFGRDLMKKYDISNSILRTIALESAVIG